jgi:hypothetical protein
MPNVILRSTWDIELNSDWIDTIVALTDNLIENACKYSGLRDATPISFLLLQSQSQLQIIVSNPVRADELGKIRAKAPNIKSALSCEITEDILRGKGGTGLIRVRYAGSKADPNKFELTFNESSLDRGKIEFVATFRGIESDLVNVATQNISS